MIRDLTMLERKFTTLNEKESELDIYIKFVKQNAEEIVKGLERYIISENYERRLEILDEFCYKKGYKYCRNWIFEGNTFENTVTEESITIKNGDINYSNLETYYRKYCFLELFFNGVNEYEDRAMENYENRMIRVKKLDELSRDMLHRAGVNVRAV